MVQYCPRWSKMVHYGPRWSKIPKWSKMLEALEKIHFANIRPERRRREGRREKKGNTRPSSPYVWFNLFSVFFSFFFVQIFRYDQVDRLFQMSHGAISPSLMVLLLIVFTICKVFLFFHIILCFWSISRAFKILMILKIRLESIISVPSFSAKKIFSCLIKSWTVWKLDTLMCLEQMGCGPL